MTGVQKCVFFFQAEDGIRDIGGLEFRRVLFRSNGVKRGLGLLGRRGEHDHAPGWLEPPDHRVEEVVEPLEGVRVLRSEERRVGREGRSWWLPYHSKKKKRVLLVHSSSSSILRII